MGYLHFYAADRLMGQAVYPLLWPSQKGLQVDYKLNRKNDILLFSAFRTFNVI